MRKENRKWQKKEAARKRKRHDVFIFFMRAELLKLLLLITHITIVWLDSISNSFKPFSDVSGIQQ